MPGMAGETVFHRSDQKSEASMPDPPFSALGPGIRYTGAACIGSLNCEAGVISFAISLPISRHRSGIIFDVAQTR